MSTVVGLPEFARVAVRRRYWGVDSVEVRLDGRTRVDGATTAATALTTGRLLYVPLLDADAALAFRIEQVERDQDPDGYELVVRGRTIDGVALDGRRIIPPAGSAYDTQTGARAETAMRHYVDAHAISATDADRNIADLALAADGLRGGLYDTAGRFQSVLEYVRELGYLGGLGWDVVYDGTTHTFRVLQGTDRSASVFFDVDFGTIRGWSEVEDIAAAKTWVLVAGQGEGTSRDLVERDAGPTGLDRNEDFIDARDVEQGDIAALEDRGDAFLEKHGPAFSITALPHQFGTFQYPRDYHLGDVVLARDAARGLAVPLRVVEVDIEASGSAAVPTVSAVLGRIIPGDRERVEGILPSRYADGGTTPGTDTGGDQDDATDGGVPTAGILLTIDQRMSSYRWDGAEATYVGGIDAGARGRTFAIHNISAFPLTLLPEDATQSAADRIITPEDAPYTIQPGATHPVKWDWKADGEVGRWRVQGSASEAIDAAIQAASGAQIDDLAVDLSEGVVRVHAATDPADVTFASAVAAVASTTDATSYATASWAPVVGALYLVFVASTKAAAPDAVASMTKTGLTLSSVATIKNAADTLRVTCWKAVGTGTNNSALTVSFGAATQTGAIISVVRVQGFAGDVSTFIRETITGRIAAGSPLSLAFTDLETVPCGTVGFAAQASGTSPNTDAGYTSISATSYATPDTAHRTKSKDAADGTFAWTGDGASDIVGVAVAVYPTAPGPTRITGFTSGHKGRRLRIQNTSALPVPPYSDADNAVLLAGQHASSAAANRVRMP